MVVKIQIILVIVPEESFRIIFRFKENDVN